MERKSFIKSLLALAAAPEIISELKIPTVAKPLMVPVEGLFTDIKLIVPVYYKELMERYGNDSFLDLMHSLGNN